MGTRRGAGDVGRTRERRQRETLNVAVITPFGSGGVYSGPTIFIDRIVRASGSGVRFHLIYAQRSASDTGFKSAPSTPLISTGRNGLINQVSWACRTTVWILRNAGFYDAIHIHGTQTYNLMAAFGAYLRGLPVLLVPLGEHELSTSSFSYRLPVIRWVRQRLLRRAAGALAISDGISAGLVSAGLAPSRIAAFGNPVDARFFATDAKRSRYSLRRVVFLGVLSDRKRPHLILEAIALLRQRGIETTALFCGPFATPSYREGFEQLIRRLKLEEVVKHWEYLEDPAEMLATDASVLVLPSREEGLPGAVVEAMAAGVPTVVTDVGAMGDTVRAAEGGYVVTGTAEGVADALASIFLAPATWQRMSAKAKEYAVARFSAPLLADEYLAAVRRAIDDKTKNGR